MGADADAGTGAGVGSRRGGEGERIGGRGEGGGYAVFWLGEERDGEKGGEVKYIYSQGLRLCYVFERKKKKHC